MAKGSQTTRGAYPSACFHCGKPIHGKNDSAWYESVNGELRSWHMECALLHHRPPSRVA